MIVQELSSLGGGLRSLSALVIIDTIGITFLCLPTCGAVVVQIPRIAKMMTH